MSNIIKVPIEGTVYWVKLWFRDNRSNPEGDQVVHTEEHITRKVSTSDFNEQTKQTIKDTKVGAKVGASYGVQGASVNTEVSFSKEVIDTFTNTVRQQRDVSIEEIHISTHQYDIKGGGVLGLWQAFFRAPGVDISLDRTETGDKAPPEEKVGLTLTMEETKFLKSFETLYFSNGNDRPFDVLKEATGQNEDFNSGFGSKSKYVYLRPIYTNQVAEAMTDCRVRIEDKAWSGNGTDDLAKGAGGKFRYLQFNQDTQNMVKYQQAVMIRSVGKPATIAAAPGFDVITPDINQGRGHDFVYVAFKTRKAFEVK